MPRKACTGTGKAEGQVQACGTAGLVAVFYGILI